MSIRQPARGGSHAPWSRTRAIVVATWLAILVPACADEPPPPAATAATESMAAPDAGAPPSKPLPPLPRSSIAAVVQHRGELNLTDEQIEALETRDREREAEDQALRAAEEKKKKSAEDAANNASSAPPSRAPGGMRGGGMGGGGMRGAGMGGPRGGHASAGTTKPQGESLDDRLDANDTKAYLDIEDVLTPAQRDPAREIASDYRAQLYDRRQQQRAAPK